MIVCHCHRISDRVVRAAIASGAKTEEEVAKMCGAGTCCGGCVETVSELIDEQRLLARRSSVSSAA
jgi:bacterioferritin-associated ferredoxin